MTRGNDFFSEAVLFHRTSKTLIVADLVENLREEILKSPFARWLAKLFDVFGRPLPSPEFRMYTSDPQAACARLDEIIPWDFEHIPMAHGAVITEGPHETLREVRDFLSAEAGSRSLRRATLYGFLAARQ